MRRARPMRPVMLAAGGGLLVLAAIGLTQVGGERKEGSAPPAVLDRIAAKNRKAAIEAAAQFKTKAEATTRAAELEARSIADRPAGTDEVGGQSGR